MIPSIQQDKSLCIRRNDIDCRTCVNFGDKQRRCLSTVICDRADGYVPLVKMQLWQNRSKFLTANEVSK